MCFIYIIYYIFYIYNILYILYIYIYIYNIYIYEVGRIRKYQTPQNNIIIYNELRKEIIDCFTN